MTVMGAERTFVRSALYGSSPPRAAQWPGSLHPADVAPISPAAAGSQVAGMSTGQFGQRERAMGHSEYDPAAEATEWAAIVSRKILAA
jgi:hypothetical protein